MPKPGLNNIPECCSGTFFAGDSKLVKIEVPELTTLAEFEVEFSIVGRGWVLQKTRTSGITTANNVISIRFDPEDTQGHAGVHNYRVKLISPSDEISTVAWGDLILS